MEFQANPRDIRILMDLADEGTLGLPEFQRNFIWRPPAVADLLRTVARNWPAGSFLLLEGPQDFACRPLEDAPQLIKEPTLLILDGQQRITALYQAFRNESTETYFVDMHALLEAGELEDEHLAYQKKSRFTKRFPTIKAAAEEGLITIPMLADDQQFFRWVSFASENQRDAFVGLRDKQLSGFKFYSIPCVVLPKEVPLSTHGKNLRNNQSHGGALRHIRLDGSETLPVQLLPT